jgi:hypothetical protein
MKQIKKLKTQEAVNSMTKNIQRVMFIGVIGIFVLGLVFFAGSPSSAHAAHNTENQIAFSDDCGCHTTPTQPPNTDCGCHTQPIEAVCYANPASVNIGSSISWVVSQLSGGNGSYAFSWSGDDGLSGSGQSVQKTYTSSGNKNASVLVTSHGESYTASCSATVVQPPPPGLNGTCLANPVSALVGATITWSASATGGNNSYVYSWSGDDGLSGNGVSISHIYNSVGTYNAHVAISSGAQSIIVSCPVSITAVVLPPPPPPPQVPPVIGGGGLNQPIVSLIGQSIVTSAPVTTSYITLSQVPYTGLADYPPSVYFTIGLVFWSIFAAGGYMWVKERKVKRV